jgi:predicted DNA-binding transcriptional regulator YafY
MVWWRAHWYLVGHDTDRADLRVFRASRIDGTVRSAGPSHAFAVPDGFDARSAIGRFAEGDRVSLDVALAPGVGAALRRSATARTGPGAAAGATGPASSLGTWGPAGWDVLALDADDLPSGVSAVLAHGAGAVVVGPAAAVDEARRQLEALIAAHGMPAPPPGRAQSTSAPRAPGAAQFSRLLALVPWLAANSGVSVAVAAAHFGITEEQLRADLGSVITSGADDWTLFDIQYWEAGGVIEVIDALELAKPLTLTPDEGFALLVALHALAAVPGPHDRAVLDSLTAKLTAALGSTAPAPGAVAVRVDLPQDLVAVVDDALAAHRALALNYLNPVRDEVTQRIVDPVGVVVVDGYGYLRAHCRTAQALRLFRLDRILDLRLSAQPALPTPDAGAEVEPMAVSLAATGRRVVVDLPADSPVLDRHPTTRRWSLPDGAVRAEIPVGDFEWARRLVLGAAGTVVLREPGWLVDQVRAEADRARALHARDVVHAFGSE